MAGTNNNNSKKSAPESPPKPVSDFLGKEVRVGLKDGRYFTGIVASFQGNGDLVLFNAVAFREFSEASNNGVKETDIKHSGLLAIPFVHVTSLHKRVEGHTPISEHITNRRLAQQRRMQQRDEHTNADEPQAAVAAQEKEC